MKKPNALNSILTEVKNVKNQQNKNKELNQLLSKIQINEPKKMVILRVTIQEKQILAESAKIEGMSIHALIRYHLRKLLRGDIIDAYKKQKNY